MKTIIVKIIHIFIFPFFLLVYGFVVLYKFMFRSKKPRLVWGPMPLINNKYWSNALNKGGYISQTFMNSFYAPLHKENDYDKYTYNLFPHRYFSGFVRNLLLSTIMPYQAFLYAVLKFDIFHHHYSGGFLHATPFSYVEAQLLHIAKCKVIITAYGSDFYRYSKINSISLRHALQINYPLLAKKEGEIQKRVNYWTKNADIVMNGFQIDGNGRWDLLPFNGIAINEREWSSKKEYSKANGIGNVVRIMHTPNHRGVKGTEYIIKAVDELIKEGFMIELILAEKKSNEEVRRLMQSVDILAEQLIIPCYALSGIEGMVTGIPVLSNLSEEDYTRVFRRYSYLNECPILSTTPENVKENLRILILNPNLREELGRAGRAYVEKYHSEKTAQYMFGKIYDKIWYGKEVDLINMFHPLFSTSYNNSMPLIEHSLIENKLPSNYPIEEC